MEQYAHSYSRPKRFIMVSAREALRRLLEMLLQCVGFSMISILAEGIGLGVNTSLYYILQIFLFLGYQLCTVYFCGRSIQRVRYYGRYCAANCIAYIVFFAICFVAMLLCDFSLYMIIFRVTFSFMLKQSTTIEYVLFSLLAFHAVTVILILLVPVRRIWRRHLHKRS